jgi:hypothetical protein
VKATKIMRLALVCSVLFLSLVAGTAIYQSFMTSTASAQFPDLCNPPLYPTGCHKFDSQLASCCGNGTFTTTGQFEAGFGNQASVSKTTACDGGSEGCTSECAPTAVASTSDCSTPTPTPTPTPAECSAILEQTATIKSVEFGIQTRVDARTICSILRF